MVLVKLHVHASTLVIIFPLSYISCKLLELLSLTFQFLQCLVHLDFYSTQVLDMESCEGHTICLQGHCNFVRGTIFLGQLDVDGPF
jgi:hypothetical protein